MSRYDCDGCSFEEICQDAEDCTIKILFRKIEKVNGKVNGVIRWLEREKEAKKN